jgi:hypothetical protein
LDKLERTEGRLVNLEQQNQELKDTNAAALKKHSLESHALQQEAREYKLQVKFYKDTVESRDLELSQTKKQIL